MFVEFLYELRDRGVKVGPQEAMSIAQALRLGLHKGTLDGFYETARALCVHREQDLDGFDRAFAHHFRGVPDEAIALTEELMEWLQQPKSRRELTELEQQLLQRMDLDQVRQQMRERLAQQRQRHDRGNRWVGTAGTSPHGSGGTNLAGIKVGDAPGGRGALEVAGERHFKDLRSDVTLDTRQIEVALRRLRAFVREGAEEELDIDYNGDALDIGFNITYLLDVLNNLDAKDVDCAVGDAGCGTPSLTGKAVPYRGRDGKTARDRGRRPRGGSRDPDIWRLWGD